MKVHKMERCNLCSTIISDPYNVPDTFISNLDIYLLRLPEFPPSIILCNCLTHVQFPFDIVACRPVAK
jgi:hypothetical protein